MSLDLLRQLQTAQAFDHAPSPHDLRVTCLIPSSIASTFRPWTRYLLATVIHSRLIGHLSPEASASAPSLSGQAAAW